MSRTIRASVGDVCYHVINRGNARATVFYTPADYDIFVRLIGKARRLLPMRVFSYCLMPNHFHLGLKPYGDGELSEWMNILMNMQIKVHKARWNTTGHIWQGRFKASAIQEDEHLGAVITYIEDNPVRAGLVQRADEWPWSSLTHQRRMGWMTDVSPLGEVRAPRTLDPVIVDEISTHLHQQLPYGGPSWREKTAVRLGRPLRACGPGRPPDR
jgi:putative transposase